MHKKHTLNERFTDFKAFIIYVTCIRVLQFYGSSKEFKNDISFLVRWSNNENKSIYSKTWKEVASKRNRLNSCLYFPRAAVYDVLGYVYDGEGRKVRITVEDFKRENPDFLMETRHRHGVKSIGQTQISWTKKYFLNKRMWHMIMDTENAMYWRSLDSKVYSERLRKIIRKHYGE